MTSAPRRAQESRCGPTGRSFPLTTAGSFPLTSAPISSAREGAVTVRFPFRSAGNQCLLVSTVQQQHPQYFSAWRSGKLARLYVLGVCQGS